MFKRIKLRILDMRTISKLISGADEEAHNNGEDKPGAEHYLLSALRLPDGTARRVFERIGVDPEQFQKAIEKQYSDALNAIGIDKGVLEDDPEPVKPDRLLHNSKPSGQSVMKKLYALKKGDKDRPLLGAHVISVIANMKHGVAARSLRAMGVDQAALATAAKEEIDSFRC
ncbi:MAG: Clp protease N-terminal domain-containing protein [Candidatus Thiodiazotropha sp. (ex Dulcina madagascariensis)]|nr:Clp protease N-terminal domain-containing protein [Candidatus Thiodiazotropha sp. (ex Dulcina madagascariensis)]